MMPDRENKEKRRHSTPFIPYSSYECRIPEYFSNVPMHWHGEFELNYILNGKGEFICGNKKFTAGKGDLLILPPNMLHAAYPYRNGSLVYHALVFHPNMLGVNSNDRCTTECIRPIMNNRFEINNPIRPDSDSYPQLRASVEQIFSCVISGEPRQDLLLKSELLRLFWLLEKDDTLICKMQQKTDCGDIIRPALCYMAENFRENISLDGLAALVHLSKSYFMGCFKKAVGVGAMEHLTQLRINAACESLSDTDMSVADIAFHCGYNNLSNFNRHFKRLVGCPPLEYRKRTKALLFSRSTD